MELDVDAGYGEIGYWVARDARGRGVATRAVALLRDCGATSSGSTRIELLVHEDNAAVAGRRRADRASRTPASGAPRPGPSGDGRPTTSVYGWSAA